MSRQRIARRIGVAATVTSVVALAVAQPIAAGTRSEAQGARKTVAVLTTADLRVVVVATRSSGGGTPTAEVRVAFARRVRGGWREAGEKRLPETYFWHTVTGPRAVCRLETATAGSRAAFRPYVAVQLLLSPSLGCGRPYRISLAT